MVLLLAEDEQNDVLLFRRAIRKAALNITLQHVCDGEEAIHYLCGQAKYKDRATYPFPDLLVVDLKMPRKNGFDVIEWVRRSMANRLRVVVLSSSAERRDVNRAYDLGANSYLTKPHQFEELTAVLTNLHAFWGKMSERPDPTGGKDPLQN